MFDFMLPSDANYFEISALTSFSIGTFMWRLLGHQGEVSKEMENVFVANRHTLYLEDEELKKKYQSYLDVNMIPEKYKTGRTYYENHERIKEKRLSELDNEDIKLDENLKQKLKILFSTEASPGLADAEVLKLLPKTYLIVSEWDTLKDQDLIYAERLKANGVQVEVAFYDNVFHGMLPIIDESSGFNTSRKVLDDLVNYLKENF